MKYRADIDGLRAIAVLAVVGFHAGVPWLTGGFAGVDVFFVISGFLIGGVVAERQAQGDFSLGWFWERRIRRIFPSLMVVLAVTTALSAWLLLPGDFIQYGQSMGAALVSLSNVFFWSTSDYFADENLIRPLLHTWSLAVEEQFYLVFPVLMLLTARFAAGRVRTVLGVLAAVSLAFGVWQTSSHAEAAFYLPFARAWELLAGVLLAVWKPAIRRPALQHATGITGLGLIVVACLLFTKDTDWPGVAAIVPVLGAVLVIAGEGGIAGRLLAAKPMVWIGLLSYSLYLWHWPLLTLQRFVFPGGWPTVFTVLASFVLAALSLRYVERPFRSSAFLTRRQVFAAGAASIAVLGLVAGGILLAKGFPARFDARSLAMADSRLERSRGSYRDGTCFISYRFDAKDYRKDLCNRRDPAKPDWLLVGDSHAAHLWSGLKAANPDLNIMQVTSSGCEITLTKDPVERDVCTRMAKLVYGDLLINSRPDGVILAGRWWGKDLPRLTETLDWFKARDIPVILVGPIPQYSSDLTRLLILSWRFNDPGLPARRRLDWPKTVDADLRTLAGDRGVPYISLYDLLCDAKDCTMLVDAETPLQWDYGHMTPEGSRFVADRLRAQGLFPRGPAPAPSPGSR
jgi:peptidoglycan/LPS O-acetylase OafA/YrhL